MADNYLERRQEEIAAKQRQKPVHRGAGASLDTLLKRNRSYRGFDPSRVVTEEELRTLVGVVPFVASGMNRQVLRFRLVTEPGLVLPHITLGGALPEEHLPKSGLEPRAFIVVCSTVPEDRIVDMDLGFAAQSILLKAVEMGLGGIFVQNFRREALRAALDLPLDPLAVIAIGRPAESIYLLPTDDDTSLQYYRKDGIHYVPKLTIGKLLI